VTTKAIIAEDEPLLAANLRQQLAQVWPELELCAVAADGYAALQAIECHRPDVLFLDIQLPGLDGLELARLAGQRAQIVFVTAFDQFAVPAFNEGAVDYLMKPLDPARLARAVLRVKARLDQAPAGPAEPDGASPVNAAPEPLHWITVQQGRELQLIAVDEICYLRADHKYVAVVTAGSEALISTPLKDMLSRLDPGTFWQIHRSIVVNIRAVRSISRSPDGALTLHLKQRAESLPVSAAHAHLFKQW
jgi:DNA-binding LytR/AlgR family response regulator